MLCSGVQNLPFEGKKVLIIEHDCERSVFLTQTPQGVLIRPTLVGSSGKDVPLSTPEEFLTEDDLRKLEPPNKNQRLERFDHVLDRTKKATGDENQEASRSQ